MKSRWMKFIYKSRLWVAFMFALSHLQVFAQSPHNLPLHFDMVLDAEARMASLTDTNLTAFRPFRHYSPHSFTISNDTSKNWLKRKFLTESLFSFKGNGYSFLVDPLFNFSIGQNANGRNLYANTRGIRLMGLIGEKVAYQTSLYLSEDRVPEYMDSLGRASRVLPGRFVFGNTGSLYQFAYVTGYLSYSPSRNFNLQVGNDRQFIGEGYRSILLSDYAPPFAYFKLTTEAGPIRYTNLYTQMIDNRSPRVSRMLGKPAKYVVMHHLDVRLSKRLQAGFFQSVVTAARDTSGNYRGFDLQYLNPIIFLTPVEFSLGSPDNTLLGTSLKFKLSSTDQLYGQFLLDELKFSEFFKQRGWWANKYSVQVGYKSYKFAGVDGLFARLEGNLVRPYTYSHWGPEQSYVHNNLPLAHPLGSNFAEILTQWRYKSNRWLINAQLHYAITGSDTAGRNYGNEPDKNHDLYVNTYDNVIGQGLRHDWYFAELRAAYLLNPSTNMRIELSLTHRGMTNRPSQRGETWMMLTFATRLENLYQEF